MIATDLGLLALSVPGIVRGVAQKGNYVRDEPKAGIASGLNPYPVGTFTE